MDHFKTIEENIARIANAVQWHNQSSDNKDCHEYSEISVSKVTSPRIVFVAVVGCLFVMNIDFFWLFTQSFIHLHGDSIMNKSTS